MTLPTRPDGHPGRGKPGRTMALRVTFLVPYPPGRSGGQRFRFEQWLSLLAPASLEVAICPFFTTGTFSRLYQPGHNIAKAAATAVALSRRVVDALRATRADVAFVYREAFALGPPVLEAFLEARVPVVYDFDDAIWLGDTSAANAAVARLKRPSKVAKVVAGAALTTVGNPFLAQWAKQHSPRVRVIPTTLDVEQYRPPARRQDRPLVRIGWMGSPTTSAHLHLLDGILRQVLAGLPAELVVIGDAAFRLPGAKPGRLTVKAWRAEDEAAEVGAFDLCLMPLPDTEWGRGKCGFKALLGMAMGVPAVVSPVGVNTDIVAHGHNGLVADSPEEWLEAIGSLVGDAVLRRRLGAAGRDTVVDRYSGQRWAPVFLETLREAAERERN